MTSIVRDSHFDTTGHPDTLYNAAIWNSDG
jgi:hypothetical protein